MTPIREMKIETEQLIRCLAESLAEPGSEVSYETLNKKAGLDLPNKSLHLLRTAIKHAEELNGCWIEVVPKKGVRHVPPGEVPKVIARQTGQVRRKAKRAAKRSTRVDYDAMSDDEKTALNIERSLLYFVSESTTEKSRKRLTEAVRNNGALPFQKTLEHFQGS